MIKPNNAYPVKLGELKGPLQIEACETDRSLHWLIRKILRTYVESKYPPATKPPDKMK